MLEIHVIYMCSKIADISQLDPLHYKLENKLLVSNESVLSTYDRQRIVGADISSAPSNQREGK